MNLEYELKVAEELSSVLSSSMDITSKIEKMQNYYDEGSYVAAGYLAELYAGLQDHNKAEYYYYKAIRADGELGNTYQLKYFEYIAKDKTNTIEVDSEAMSALRRAADAGNTRAIAYLAFACSARMGYSGGDTDIFAAKFYTADPVKGLNLIKKYKDSFTGENKVLLEKAHDSIKKNYPLVYEKYNTPMETNPFSIMAAEKEAAMFRTDEEQAFREAIISIVVGIIFCWLGGVANIVCAIMGVRCFVRGSKKAGAITVIINCIIFIKWLTIYGH